MFPPWDLRSGIETYAAKWALDVGPGAGAGAALVPMTEPTTGAGFQSNSEQFTCLALAA